MLEYRNHGKEEDRDRCDLHTARCRARRTAYEHQDYRHDNACA